MDIVQHMSGHHRCTRGQAGWKTVAYVRVGCTPRGVIWTQLIIAQADVLTDCTFQAAVSVGVTTVGFEGCWILGLKEMAVAAGLSDTATSNLITHLFVLIIPV